MEGSASQAGFYYQNNIAASKIIDCLFFETDIVEVKLENYDKGNHIDDVIIYRKERAEYYQIKWSEDGDNSYTLYNLLTGNDSKKSILKQLAEGYRSVKDYGNDFSITLLTTKRESNHKRPSENIHSGLKDIRTEIIEPLRQSNADYTTLSAYTDHKEALEKIRTECGLSEIDFPDFLKRLMFRFSQEPVEQIRKFLEMKFEKLGIERNLVDKLLDNVVKWSITGESITRSKVLTSLGLVNRFEDKLSHYFRVVDNEHYVANQQFFNELTNALDTLPGGYVFIEGLPGIGKSTALTKFKESNPEITLAYYCFIPDATHNFGALRHTGEYFLKSLCIAIENHFQDIDLPQKYSDKYAEKFASYLETLSVLNRKIFFVIDGLDHVHRDLDFTPGSLLNHIKGELPDNIFFILSSQYISALSGSVKAQVAEDPRRHIKVPRFSQADIHQYLESKGIRSGNSLVNQVEKTSGGIPLYLHYISELLRSREPNEYEDILRELPTLSDGKINAYHEALYQKVAEDDFVRWVLAVLAYRKEYTNSETLREILALLNIPRDVIEIETVLRRYSHLLRQIDGRGFLIFHNSFREFLIHKTPSLEQTFNKALVRYYEKYNSTDEAYRNYFSHLFALGEYNKILSATTLAWMKKAWSDFRSTDELKQNIDIAIQASIESLRLSEFIRVGFLKAQLDMLSDNLDGSEIDPPLLLLHANLERESLRSIWDGDFVTVDKNGFLNYLKEYYKKNRKLLPENMLKQGLLKHTDAAGDKEITKLGQVASLLTNDIVGLLKNVDNNRWTQQENNRPNSRKKEMSSERTVHINKKIKIRIINYLKEAGKVKELYQLFEQKVFDHEIQTAIQVSLIQLLLPSSKNDALDIARELDINALSDKLMSQFISSSADYLSDDELIRLSGGKKPAIPSIHEKIIDEPKGVHYGIRESVIELFESLKAVQVLQPDQIPVLQLKVSALRSPVKDFYEAIFSLSELWYHNRTGNLTEDKKISAAKRILQQFCLKEIKAFRTTSRGLFESDTDDHFLKRDIHKIFSVVFKAFTRIFSSEAVAEITDYWMELTGTGIRYEFYKNELEVAKVLQENQPDKHSDRILRLLQKAEKSARREEDTGTLLNYLGDIAKGYGLCGYSDDFKRLYDGFIETAFGVSYRKDYQASYIVRALEAMHKEQPAGTPRRLAEVFSIQQQMAEAGNGRMHHIVISGLITFAATHYPELAFFLLPKEEKYISRAETLEMMLEPLIAKAGKDELPLLFSIVKTIPKWSKSDGAHDNHFLSTTEALLERALKIKEESFIASLLKNVVYNAEVELNDCNELKRFSELLIRHDIDPGTYGLPASNPEVEKQPASRKRTADKFNLPQRKHKTDEWVQLFKKDYREFANRLKEEQILIIKNRLNQAFRTEYNRSKSTFEKFYSALSQADKDARVHQQAIRYFIDFKNRAILSISGERIHGSDIQPFLKEFIETTDKLFGGNRFKSFIEESYDEENWLSNLLRTVNYFGEALSSPLTEQEVFVIVENAPLLKSDQTREFIQTWTSGRTAATAMVKLAGRLFTIDPDEAKEILSQVASDERDNSLFSNETEQEKPLPDVLITALKNDQTFGKNLLMQSFRAQKAKYAYSFLSGVSYLMKYKAYFKGEDVATAYYEANLQYNRELSKGLPPKTTDYEFIRQHAESLSFEQITIRYLVTMLDYPVVKVRELALQSLFDLAVDTKESYLKETVSCGASGTDNGVEYWLVLLHAVTLAAPGKLLPYKAVLWQVLNRCHFNILESAKSLLLVIEVKNPGFLSKEEMAVLQQVNTKNLLVLPPRILYNQNGSQLVFSSYQSSLLDELSSNEKEDTSFEDDVYTDLDNRGWKSYSPDTEAAFHQRYNINGHFDEIEIQSDYYRALQQSINRVFADKIKQGCFSRSFTKSSAGMFRVYDPARLLYRTIARPAYINWLPSDTSEEDFLAFADFGALIQEFAGRETDFITLFEKGSQRSDGRNEHDYTTYFEVSAYVKTRGADDSMLTFISYVPAIETENQYASELPASGASSIRFPVPGIQVMLETSVNIFRGIEEGAQANLLKDMFARLNIAEATLLDIITKKSDAPMRAFTWQDAYTSGTGRRRYKPISDGFTLKIEKEVLSRYLEEQGLTLCYHVNLRRSATKYRPESHMKWHEKSETFELSEHEEASSE